MKTIVYVDGYNLFYGCLKHTPFKWLDLYKLFVEQIIRVQDPALEVIQVKFFTADIKAKVASNGQLASQAQQSYHRALEARYPEKIEIIKGYYSLEKAKLPIYINPPDKSQGVDVWKLEEKETDVNIALTAYRDVVKGNAEHIVFVSNDTDIFPALQAIREDYDGNVHIGVIIPVRQHENARPANAKLSNYADWTRKYITTKELESSQLPNTIPTKKKPIKKPEYW
ncbi:NYN domain-containing protein [Aliidiomarina celeris]|uniref:NYN domain-containing protein n=1 Tax=Aliidiomarina celeris TaxID=2249428 RepID=UPI000DE99BC2|nr:NYN domain-containing protein [Aliidiomarina celeris]